MNQINEIDETNEIDQINETDEIDETDETDQTDQIMERVFRKSRNFKESEEWDILQHIGMTSEERQKVAAELRKRVYGEDVPDVRETQPRK